MMGYSSWNISKSQGQWNNNFPMWKKQNELSVFSPQNQSSFSCRPGPQEMLRGFAGWKRTHKTSLVVSMQKCKPEDN